MASSKYTYNENGERVLFNSKIVYDELLNAAKRGERVIGVASYKRGNINELTFIALIVMKDKIREGVSESVLEVKNAGIQIVMLTGDSLETACAIAEECGIYKPNYHLAITSATLKNMSDSEIKEILPRLRVLARSLPQDKTRLVRLSGEMDLVVGMTGDGINDAPSLKLSDVGFAMGSGADIAKSASDIVILDNSFTAISKAILYGRTIFNSIRKFITFQLMMNLAACGVSLIGQFIGVETPITIIQMLWVNIIMDTLGGLAFAGEAPLKDYMREKPKRRDEPILTKSMLSQIFISGGFTLILCIVFLTSPNIRHLFGANVPSEKFYTAFYALFIFSGIFNCFCSRCERLYILSDIEKNKPFIFIMLIIAVIQCFMIYFGGSVFRCTPLSVKELVFVVVLSFSVIPFEFIRRIFYRLG